MIENLLLGKCYERLWQIFSRYLICTTQLHYPWYRNKYTNCSPISHAKNWFRLIWRWKKQQICVFWECDEHFWWVYFIVCHLNLTFVMKCYASITIPMYIYDKNKLLPKYDYQILSVVLFICMWIHMSLYYGNINVGAQMFCQNSVNYRIWKCYATFAINSYDEFLAMCLCIAYMQWHHCLISMKFDQMAHAVAQFLFINWNLENILNFMKIVSLSFAIK